MITRQLVHQFSIAKYRLHSMIHRYRLAIAYARNRIDPDQANDIIYDCQAVAGWFPLEEFSVDSCLETALDCHWQPHPELENLVRSACADVAGKWRATAMPPARPKIGRWTSSQNSPRHAGSISSAARDPNKPPSGRHRPFQNTTGIRAGMPQTARTLLCDFTIINGDQNGLDLPTRSGRRPRRPPNPTCAESA